VLSNREIAPGYRLLVVETEIDLEIGAGQFAMLRPYGVLEPLLRRALAVYRSPSPKEISFLYQVLGRGTQALSHLTKGGQVEALIPLGNAWPMPGEGDSSAKRALVVAGGIGSASLLMLAERLRCTGIGSILFFGAASESSAQGCGLNDFTGLGLPMVVTTDDGSLGERGFVTGPLERHLRESETGDAVIYTCGPWPMMRRVAELARAANIECYASLEAPMACGFGICVGCVVAVEGEAQLGYDSYKRVCVDGSIFPAARVRWEIDAMQHH
jgi:dihydroorotate dehydrogenase electron transfer subunit